MCFQEGLKGPKSTRYICKDLFIRALQKPDRYNTYHCQAIMSVRATRVLSAMRFVLSGPGVPPAVLILNTAARSGLC